MARQVGYHVFVWARCAWRFRPYVVKAGRAASLCANSDQRWLQPGHAHTRYFVLDQRQLHVYDDKSRMHAGPKATIALTGCVVRVSSLDTFEFVLTTPNDVSGVGPSLIALWPPELWHCCMCGWARGDEVHG